MSKFISFLAAITAVTWLGCGKKLEHKPTSTQPTIVFGRAKVLAEKKIYFDHRTTFYCYCSYSDKKVIDASSCGYVPRNNNIRAKRMEWEHIVPAAKFGMHRKCWTACSGKPGRECCRDNDPEFRKMEGDLMNLVPSVGELNADRSDREYGTVAGEPRAYGKCDFEVDFDKDVVEPPDTRLGDIGRTYLYMYNKYPGGLPLTEEELARYKKWSRDDPEDDWERTRRARIEKVWREYK